MLLGVLLGASACQDMYDQPRMKTYAKSELFEDGRSARPVVAGTIARGHLKEDELLYAGKLGGKDADLFPFRITAEVMARGKERYEIYCTPCHDRTGSGRGMVVRRGFRPPPTFHQDRLRAAPAGHYFDVISNGFGSMFSYASRISPRDRWAIIAYVRALQLSQNARLDDVPGSERGRIEEPR
jgi:hypothetical protein